MLVSTIIEGTHHQRFFAEHLPRLTNVVEGEDSVTITGNYALSYAKTSISEIKGNVIVINHTDKSRLETEQLFWDEETKYFVSEKAFTLMKEKDTVFGIGFESKDDLTKHLAKKTTGRLETSEE